MKKNRSLLRLLSLTLLLLLVLPSFAACKNREIQPFAIVDRVEASPEVFTSGYYEYKKYNDGTAKLVAYTGSERSLILPDSFDGCKLVELDVGVFSYNTNLTSIVLNPSLESIGAYAFVGCTALSTIEFGKKLWSVGISALSDTPWLAAQPEDFVIVGDNLLLKYQGKELSVTVPEGVRHVCAAFADNIELRSVYLPDTVVTVGNAAFCNCLSLVYVEMSPNTVLVDQYAFYGCTELVLSELPKGVERIGQYAFYDNFSLQGIRCGDSLKSIGRSAFCNCGEMRMIEVPATLVSIDTDAFEDCVSLKVVFYGGTEEQFKAIQYLEEENTNSRFKDATKFYSEESK